MKKRFKKVYIEITNKCNKNCSFCSSTNRKPKEINLEKFEHILINIKNYTDYIYLHVKGEPLLHSNFNKILQLCKKYDFKVNITTNGTLLDKKIEDIIESNCVRQINISMHSFEDDKNYLNKILIATNKLLNCTNIYVVYRFWALNNYKLTNNQINDVNEILVYYDKQIKKDEVLNMKNVQIVKNLYINKDNLFLWPSLNYHNFEEGMCYGLKHQLAILSDGTVVPCCLDAEGIINLGNIFKESMSNILNKKKTIQIIKSFENNKCSELLCKKCQYRTTLIKNNKMSSKDKKI